MKNILALLFLLLHIPSFGQSNEQQQLIEMTISKYQSCKSMSYNIEYMMKFFDEDEPFFMNSNVYIIRDDRDNVFKSKFLYNRQDDFMNYLKYYHSPELYVIDLNTESIVRSDASKGETSPITGNVDGNVLDIYFPNISRFQKKIKNTKYKVSYLDTDQFLKITIAYPDDEDYYDCEESVYIDKTSQTISQKSFQIRYKDQIQKSHWYIDNIVFDQLNDSDFEKRIGTYLKTFKTEDYKPLTEEDFKLLDIGTTAPKIDGKIFPDYDNIIEVNTGKIMILDFWYTSCMPCIKTIPHLNRLKEKYQDKIEIIGINPIENEEKHREKINDFLKRTPMNYPILLVDSIPPQYNIRVYPTLYILNENGTVIYTKIGQSENMYEELDQFLSELTNEH